MENGEPLFILNPFDYTVHHQTQQSLATTDGQYDELSDKKGDEEDVMADFETQQNINWRIQSNITMAVRDPKQKARVDALKAKGLY